MGRNARSDKPAANRRGQRRPGRSRRQDGAADDEAIGLYARQEIGHQQPDRKAREIDEHADEIEQRKARSPKSVERDDRPRRASLAEDEGSEGKDGQQGEPDGGELAKAVERQ